MINETIFYRRNLPHIHPKDGIFFITFRLAGSLPVRVLEQLREEREHETKMLKDKHTVTEFAQAQYKLHKRYFSKFDRLLDRVTIGPQWLKEKGVAQIIAKKVHDLDGKRYRLMAYCIMSNHVHLLLDTAEFDQSSATNTSGKTKDYPLGDTMRLIKGSTARFCNIELGRKGKFWHTESYDHYARDEEEVDRIVHYIISNPVKTGLVKGWRNWQFSYLADCNATFML